ncbi:diguanylate cyclase [Granulicella sp. dw_53]|uniref:diguanylate cyclase n=1 Tax=Granulicella sp. dw_53 TaxID=2719792 RepID=UPI001BD26FC8|nr:diguanylate cyclase [Granulicella sp. dw_53]
MNVVLTGFYDYRLVALSIVIAILSAYTAVELAERVTPSTGLVRFAWLSGGAWSMGVGIWAMHYIGMEAFRLPVPVLYDLPTVGLSMLAAIFASGVALYLVSRPTMGILLTLAGSICMGGGISAMHYIGMEAMRLPAMCLYSPWKVVLSVVLSILIASFALRLIFKLHDGASALAPRKLISALAMGAAIPVMHYSGMAAVTFMSVPLDKGLDNSQMSHAISISRVGLIGIALTTTLILGFIVMTAILDRRASLANMRNRAQMVDAIPVGVSWASLIDQKIVYTNRMFTELFGYRIQDLTSTAEFVAKVLAEPEDRDRAKAQWDRYLGEEQRGRRIQGKESTIEPMELNLRCKDGAIKTVLHSGVILPDLGWAMAIFVDISERKQNEQLLHEAEKAMIKNQAIYQTLLSHSREMVVLAPLDTNERSVSPAVFSITGWTPEEYLRKERADLIHPDDLSSAMQTLQRIRDGELSQSYRYRAARKDGSYLWVEAFTSSYFDPDSHKPLGFVATIRDIQEQKQQEDQSAKERLQLSKFAREDELTGLTNRRAFRQTLQEEGRRQSRSANTLSLLILDIDYFKQYNDLYGHLRGDICLKRVADTLRFSLKREADLVARYGGEEFVILLPTTDQQGATAVAKNILAAVSSLAIEHKGSPFGLVTVSIGVTTWPAATQVNDESFLEEADIALYSAKHSGRNTYSIATDEVVGTS